ncbi:MAG TPA: hypothetical protein V6C76_05225 [Drouetiella sp.]
MEIGIAVVLLVVIGLLISNIFVIHLAKEYNDKACKLAVLSAARALVSGQDAGGIQKAALDGLNDSPQGGYFIEHPTFLDYQDEKTGGVRHLKVQTQTIARVPFPILLIDGETQEHGGELTFKSTYIVEFAGKKQ